MKDLDTNKLAENAFGALGKAEETLANLDYSGIQDEKIRAQLELARLQGTAKAGGRSTIVIASCYVSASAFSVVCLVYCSCWEFCFTSFLDEVYSSCYCDNCNDETNYNS